MPFARQIIALPAVLLSPVGSLTVVPEPVALRCDPCEEE